MFRFNQKGFTLIELLVVVAIVGIIAAIALPSYKRLVDSSRIGAQSSEFLTTLFFARSEAVKRNSRVTMCKSQNSTGCATTGSWAAGWVVFVDTSTVGTVDSADTILRVHAPLTGGTTLIGTTNVADFVSFTSNGLSPQSGQFDLCGSDTAVSGRDIVLSVGTGRPSVSVDPAPCS